MKVSTRKKWRKVSLLLMIFVLLTQYASLPLSAFAETGSTKEPNGTDTTDNAKDYGDVVNPKEDTEETINTEDYDDVVDLKEVTEETVNTKALAVDENGVVHYNGEPLFVGNDDELIPAKLQDLMKEGVSQKLVTKKEVSILEGVVNSILSLFSAKVVEASDKAPVIKYNGSIKWGLTRVGDFTVDGVQAFCIEHSKASPPSNTPYNSVSLYNNDKIQKALYYGWGGPKNIFTNRAQGIVITSSVLSRIYTGEANGTSNKGYAELWDKVQNGTLPNTNFKFSDTDLSVSVSGGKQISQSTTLNADPANSATFTVPSSITVVNESTGARKTGGSVTIKGGQRFHLEAPLTYGSAYNSGSLSGSMQEYKPIITMPKSKGYQTLGFGRWVKDPAKTSSFIARFKVQQVTHTVNHVDSYTNKVVKTTNTTRTIGSSYKVCPATDLKASGYSLVSTDKCVSGNTPSKNFVTTFYYNTNHKLIINYYDNYNKKFIKEWGRWTLKAGASYNKNADTEFTYGANNTVYKVVGSNNISGKMGRGDKTVTLYFDPYQDVSVVWKNRYPANDIFKSSTERLKVGTQYNYTQPGSFTKNNLIYDSENDSTFTGTLGYADVSHTFYYKLRRLVTINYLDNRTGDVINKNKSYTLHQGDTYSETPPNNLKKGEYTYRYVRHDGDAENGTIGTDNIVMNYYYDIPLIKIGLEKIQIYTAPADEGLPVKVNLSKVYNYPENISDMTNAKLNVSLYQGNTKIASNTYTAKSLPESIEFKVPSKYLAVNQKKAYTVKFENYSSNDIHVISDAATISTDGYTSSQLDLKVNATSQTDLNYKGVVMTEREIRKNMKVFYETLTVPKRTIAPVKSGYGIDLSQKLNYTNELNLNQTNPSKLEIVVDPKLVDGDYKVENGKVVIDLLSEEKISGNTLVQSLTLPRVYVEDKTGNIFSEKQKEENDQNIQYRLYDGGNKIYVPIWIDQLGDYSYSIKSKEPIGINKVTFIIDNTINVYAYMYGHIGSKTIKYDEILIEPVDPKNPFPNGLPEGWDTKDLDWLKK